MIGTELHHRHGLRLIFSILLPLDDEKRRTDSRYIRCGDQTPEQKRKSWALLRSVCHLWRDLADEIFDFESALSIAIKWNHPNSISFLLDKTHFPKYPDLHRIFLEMAINTIKQHGTGSLRQLLLNEGFQFDSDLFFQLLRSTDDVELVKDILGQKRHKLTHNFGQYWERLRGVKKIVKFITVIPAGIWSKRSALSYCLNNERDLTVRI